MSRSRIDLMPQWTLNHNFVDHPCPAGLPKRCWTRSEGVSTQLRDEITRMLRSIDNQYQPVGERGEWLWCLGGPDLYREDGVTQEGCVDLHLSVCEKHQVVSVHLFPYDLVPESGGSSISDPRQATPISLPSNATSDLVTNVCARVESWLNSILFFGASTEDNSK